MLLLLRPLLSAWARWREAALAAVPRPDDAPAARAPGPSPLRVLLVGGGAAVGWGSRSHDLALPGALARALALRTGRGVQVDVRTDAGARVADLPRLLDARPVARYDGVVLATGSADAVRLLPARRWREALDRALARTTTALPRAGVLVVGLQPLRSVSLYASWLGGLADRHRERLDRVSRLVCARRRIAWTALPAPSQRPGKAGSRAPVLYAEWAEAIAAPLAAVLASRPPRRRAPAAQAQPEAARRAAAARLSARSAAGPGVQRVLSLARELLDAPMVGLSVVEDDRVGFPASLGFAPEPVPRDRAMCASTVLTDHEFVVGDMAADPRFAANPLVRCEGVRFYAGWPVESPDGYRVGALCVLDTRPRDPRAVDAALLSELAMLAQKELWALAWPTPSVPARRAP